MRISSDIYWTIIVMPWLAGEFGQCITKAILINKMEKESEDNLQAEGNFKSALTSFILIKSYIIFQAVLVALKLDELIFWEWVQVFWSTWVIIAIFIGIGLGSIVVFVVKFYSSMINNESWKDGKLII